MALTSHTDTLFVTGMPQGAITSEYAGLKFSLEIAREAKIARDRDNMPNSGADAHLERVEKEWAAFLAHNSDRTEAVEAEKTRKPSNSNGYSNYGPVKMASPKQTAWIVKLLDSKSHPEYTDEVVVAGFRELAVTNTLPATAARKIIDDLKDAPWKGNTIVHSTAQRPTEPRRDITEEGMYQTAAGDIYKVQRAVHGSGRLYAKALVIHEQAVRDENGTIITPADATFEYESGAIRKIAPADKMDLESAKAFGKLYGVCCKCATTLTDENSIAAGIGPICAGKI